MARSIFPRLAVAVLAIGCTDPGDPEVATETGFDCEPTCGALLCGSSSTAVYVADVVDDGSGTRRAELGEHLAGPAVDDPAYDIVVPGAGDAATGIVSFEVPEQGDTVSAWFLAIATSDDLGEHARCAFTQDGQPVLFALEEVRELVGSASCVADVNDRAPPIECPRDGAGG
jgi:hypothetical protein